MNQTINFSGSIGLSILFDKKFNKKIYVFYDDHSNKKYCSPNNYYVPELLEYFYHINKNPVFLLEEPLSVIGDKIVELWTDSEHVKKFRNFYLKYSNKCKTNCGYKIFPTDIRLALVDVSFDQFYENILKSEYFNDYDESISYYLRNIFYIFEIDNYFDKNKNDPTIKPDDNIIFISNVFNIFKSNIYYKSLKDRINNFYVNFIKDNENMKIYDFILKHQFYSFEYAQGYPFTNSNEYIMTDQLDKIFSGIMEFYIFVLSQYLSNDTVIINAGYFHCNNLEYILINYFNYEKIYQTGITDLILNMNEDNVSNCLIIETKYLK